MRLTFSPDTDVYPVWTPDGSAIAYSSVQEGVVAKPLAGTTQPRQLQPPTSSVLISSEIAPDGRLVFFGDMGTSTGFDIYTLSLSGDAQAVAAIQGPLTDAEPDLSPDGRWMAYATTETGAFEVFVQPFPPTGAKWQVSNGGGRQPQWRRDGRELYFVTNDRKLYAVDVHPGATFDFSAPRLLFHIPANTISVRNSYVPRKDGQQFLVNKLLETAAPPINIVLNWAPAAGR